MCLTLLSRSFLRIDLLEQIWLGESSGSKLNVEEVYDIFFKTAEKQESEFFSTTTTLLGLSPHGLADKNGALHVRAEKYPGGGHSKYDRVYNLNKGFDSVNGTFRVELSVSKENFQASTIECSGKVLVPPIRFPAHLADDPSAQELMNKTGTFFEIPLDGLAPNTAYAMRLVIQPQFLNLEYDPANIPEPDGSEGSTWEWDLSVISPPSLHSTCVHILNKLNEANPGVAIPLLTVLSRHHEHGPWKTALARRHRLFLLCNRGCTLTETATSGYTTFMGPRQVTVNGTTESDKRLPARLLEWAGGSEICPDDDPFEVAREVLAYVRQWGTPDPKTKAEITTSLNLRHENVSLIVDALVEKELVQDAGGAKYTSGRKCLWDAEQIGHGAADDDLRRVAIAPDVLSRFIFTGFELKYLYRFRYESPNVRQRRRRKRQIDDVVFWTGIIGAALALIALVLTIVTAFDFALATILLVSSTAALGAVLYFLWRHITVDGKGD